MAEDAGRLLVRIEATQAKFEKQMAAIAKSGANSAKSVETSFRKANDNIGKGAGGINKASQAAGQLSFQLNDIATSLAGGASPFQVMMQQGSQVAQVFTQMGGGIKGAGAAVVGAFGSMLNPISLVSFGLIAAAGYALEYFTAVDEGSENTEKALQKQRDLIAEVATKWGDALPALKAYNDELQRQEDAAKKTEALEAAVSKLTTEQQASLDAVNKQTEAIFGLFDNFPKFAGDIDAVRARWTELLQGYKDGSVTIDELRIFSADLISLLEKLPVAKARDFASVWKDETLPALSDILVHLRAITAEIDKATAASAKGLVPFSPLPAQDMNILGARDRIKSIESGGNYKALGPVTASGDRAYGAYQVMGSNIAEWTKKAIGTALTSEQFLNNPAIQDKVFDTIFGGYMQEFGAEGAAQAWFGGPGAVGKTGRKDQLGTSVGDYGKRFSQGVTEATDAWSGLREQTAATRQETAALTQQYDAFGQIAKTAVQGLTTALADGKLEGEELLQILMQIVQQMLTMPSLGGGGAGGGGLLGGMIIPGILHKGGVAGSDGYGSGRMVSASAFAGARRMHNGGIAGNEVPAILQRGEIVLPKNTRGGGSGGSVHRIVLQDDSGRMAEVADQRIRTASGDIIQISTQTSMKAVKNNFSKMAIDSERRQR